VLVFSEIFDKSFLKSLTNLSNVIHYYYPPNTGDIMGKKKKIKNPFNLTLTEAVQIAEGEVEVEENKYIATWQWLIDTEHAWNLQGFYGRAASSMIQNGLCTLPKQSEDGDNNGSK
jgi:hypothetical protein